MLSAIVVGGFAGACGPHYLYNFTEGELYLRHYVAVLKCLAGKMETETFHQSHPV